MGPGILQGDANSLVVGFFFNQLSGGTLTLMSEWVVLNLAISLWDGGVSVRVEVSSSIYIELGQTLSYLLDNIRGWGSVTNHKLMSPPPCVSVGMAEWARISDTAQGPFSGRWWRCWIFLFWLDTYDGLYLVIQTHLLPCSCFLVDASINLHSIQAVLLP